MKKLLTFIILAVALSQINEVSAIQYVNRAPANATPYERQMVNNFNMQQEQMEIQRQQLELQRQQVQQQQTMNRYYKYGY
jgi:flagellar motor protein MotB